jgi:hypothetical protein
LKGAIGITELATDMARLANNAQQLHGGDESQEQKPGFFKRIFGKKD